MRATSDLVSCCRCRRGCPGRLRSPGHPRVPEGTDPCPSARVVGCGPRRLRWWQCCGWKRCAPNTLLDTGPGGCCLSRAGYFHLEPAPAPENARPEIVAQNIRAPGVCGNRPVGTSPLGVHCGHRLLAVAVGVLPVHGAAAVPVPRRDDCEKRRSRSYHVRAAAVGAADGGREGFLLRIQGGDRVQEQVPVGLTCRTPRPAPSGLVGIPGQVRA